MSLPTSSREAPTAPDFRKDAQEFIKHFDKIRDQIDDEMINHTKDGLDSLLVYVRVTQVDTSDHGSIID
ncbi:hypothetical protein FRC04_011755 [Tulasnella sp. 424]|nr:hypothetical protein FRC04_011755 [Tulasnella sp. 424]KAG8978099.1 hypothetical protein FRC05_011215 [Tulasnella sp. 425]